MPMRTHLDVISTLAEGCGSTAWVAGVTHAHSWMMSHFPQAAQDETYGVDPDTLISAVIAPRGRAERQADGSFRLSGFWPFASGSEHAQWLFIGAEVFDGSEMVDAGDFLVPSGEITYLDDWFVTGLAGTGSCSVTLEDHPVPAHRFLSLPALIAGQTPGRGLHDGWQPGLAAFPVLILALAGGALGLARSALGSFPEVIGGKTITYTDYIQREYPSTHLMVAQATAQVDQAQFHLYRAADRMDDAARSGALLDIVERVRVRADAAEAVAMCMESVKSLFQATGGSGLRASNPIGLALADLQAMCMHGGLALEPARALYGRVLLGLEPDTVTI
ncbi:hypothetical protein [Candidatus Poriferisodalis sp.]|uniref:hypothetical protein n=1 Tax=Candidatus Poriferisodalis sp. TaxID=3101277 RepID=UPI003B02D8A0